MKFRLARPLFSEKVRKIVAREMKKNRVDLPKAFKDNLQELKAVYRVIEKKGLPDHLLCVKLPQNLGSGIFLKKTAKPLVRGEVIAFYSGVLKIVPEDAPDESAYAFDPVAGMHLTKAEQKIFDKKREFDPKRLYALYLDAQKQGNFTRFINHSEKPNVVAQLMRIPKNKWGLAPSPIEVVYMVKKKIKPGEQLLVSYEDGEKSYWSALGIKPFPVLPNTFQVDRTGKLLMP